MKFKVFFKKLFFFFMFILLVPIFAGCGSNKSEENNNNKTNSSQESEKESKQETKKANLSLIGEWKEKKSFNIIYIAATVTKDSIEINEVSNNGKTKTLRWYGTYKEPESSEDKYTWKSKKDSSKTKDSLMVYKEDTIEFSYEKGVLSYTTTSLGTTTTVELEKV